MKTNKPWLRTYQLIKQRCLNKNQENYSRYGGSGIKILISKEELKTLWFRDNATKMKCATIDRIDPKGNYVFENCRYLERSENSRRGSFKTHCKMGHLLSKASWISFNKMGHLKRTCKICARENQRKLFGCKKRLLNFPSYSLEKKLTKFNQWKESQT